MDQTFNRRFQVAIVGTQHSLPSGTGLVVQKSHVQELCHLSVHVGIDSAQHVKVVLVFSVVLPSSRRHGTYFHELLSQTRS